MNTESTEGAPLRDRDGLPLPVWPRSPGGDNAGSRTAVRVVALSGILDLLCFESRSPQLLLLLVALLLAQTGLAGMWLVMGNSPLPRRLLGVLAATGFVPVLLRLQGFDPSLFDPAKKYFEPNFLSMNLYAATVALAAYLLRLAGGRIVRRRGERLANLPDRLEPRQFSLRHVFTLTTAVAIVAGLSRYFGGIDRDQLLPTLSVVAAFAVLALSAATVALHDSRTARGIALFAFYAVVVLLMTSSRALLVPIAFVQWGTAIVTLLPFRFLGFRVRVKVENR